MARSGIKGLKQVERNISKVIGGIGSAARKGVTESALDLTRRSVRDAPVDKGDLRGSGHARFGDTEIAKGQADGSVRRTGTAPKDGPIEATVGFGMPYAHKQDQDRELNHPKGGKAGYLSDNFREQAPRYIKHIEEEAKKVVKRGGS